MDLQENSNVLRPVVVFLRAYAGMTQAELGKAARVDQSDVSKYELGKLVPPEPNLRRMAATAGVDWSLVVHLRRFYAALLATAAYPGTVPSSEPLDLALLEPVLAAVKPYLLESSLMDLNPQTPEEAQREAEEIWTTLERFPIPTRRRWIEASLRASRSWALAEKSRQESERAAVDNAAEARELADLAQFIAEQVP
jgi:transcriptional regulator with XRE-family HTH domain